MEVILSVLVYLGQLAVLGAAALAAAFLLLRLGKKTLTVPKLALTAALCLALLLGGVCWLAWHPPLYCPASLEASVSQESREEVRRINRGFYSPQLPLFPVLISIQGVTESGGVLVETHYWFFGGSTQMLVGGADGYALIRGLSGL